MTYFAQGYVPMAALRGKGGSVPFLTSLPPLCRR